MKKYIKINKIALIALLVILVLLLKYFQVDQYLTLDYLQLNKSKLEHLYNTHQMEFIVAYSLIYILLTAVSFPGATILTIAAGAIFGLALGTVIVSFASIIGATLAFLVARFFFRDPITKKFHKALQTINQGIEKNGAMYLFSLRMMPIFPFFIVNMVMGLTKMSTAKYFWVSQVGMLVGTVVYVNAGVQLAQIESLKSIANKELVFGLFLLGILPFVAQKIVEMMQNQKIYKKYKKPQKFDYNIVVIGGGAAGLVTSYIGSAVKAKVALIEKHKMGGDCLNTGCVPSKAIIRSAKVAYMIKQAQHYGVVQSQGQVDFSAVMQRVHKVIKKIEHHDSIERYTKLGVDCINGFAKILSPWEIAVNGKVITTKNIVIATGASPFVPPVKGIEQITVLTSENLWSLEILPKRLCVLGGGPIGCELAQSFQRLGSQVVLIEKGHSLLAREDDQVSEFLQKKLSSEGVQVLLQHEAKEIKLQDGKKILVLQNEKNNLEIEFDELICAIGRKANVKGFGLEELDIKLRADGTIDANSYLQTNYPNIYVCGDVTGPFQLTHVAAHQAWYCAVNALFGKIKKFKVGYDVIPWATYVDPEVATVGYNEKSAQAQQISYDVTTYGIDDLDRAIADSEDHGFVKVLTAKGSDKILGVTIVGQHASDMIVEFITAMKHNLGLNKILSTIHIYPTMSEANKYLAGEWKKKNVPTRLLKIVTLFHTFKMR